MHNHFDKDVNLKRLILEHRPKVVIECGAGEGALTRKLASLLDELPFELHVISDKELTGMDPRIHWHTGLSYEVLQVFPNDSVGLCIIDTDHNYWTLREELRAVTPKIVEGGFIALHDVETFYHDTGMALAYWNGRPYPKMKIQEMAAQGGLGDAMIMFLASDHMHWKMYAYSRENQGAAVLEKRTQTEFAIVVPGPNPSFAPPPQKEPAAV